MISLNKPWLVGGGLLLGAGVTLLALLSYHAGDPSFSHTGSGEVQNLLGAGGAYWADLLLQLFGLGAWLFPLCFGVWAFYSLRQNLPRWPLLRISACFVALPAVSAVSGLADAPLSWQVNTGMGGYVGYFLYFRLAEPMGAWVYGLVTGLIALSATLFGLGVPMRRVLAALRLAKAWITYGYQSAVHLVRGVSWLSERLKHVPVPERPRSVPRETKIEAPATPAKAPAKPAKAKRSRKKKAQPEEENKQESFALMGGSDHTFHMPSVEMMKAAPKNKSAVSEQSLRQNARILEKTLQDFGVSGEITNVRPGPVVTLYELEPAPGTKSSRVIGLADDIARSMSAVSARIAVVPGVNAMGIELPNQKRDIVYMREVLESKDYQNPKLNLPMALGKDIGGEPVSVDLAKMPHLLVAGTTGSGKSVAINTMILSLLYRLTPAECRFIMIDPKMLELSVYDGIPHLLSPVVTEPGKAVVALKWTVKEMENRYRLMSNLGVRNIGGYNQKIKEAVARGETLTRKVQTGFDPETGKPIIEELPMEMETLPYIVVIVDEMADLMLVAGKDIEGSIQRLAQMARAAGIHLIMATQRPSVDVITGVIKANFPTRISFQVTSRVDSRTILGEQGAEQLLGQGDMLYMAGGSRITRVHGGFVADEEVERVVKHLKLQGEPDYVTDVTEHEEDPSGGGAGFDIGGGSEEDDLFRKAVEVVCRDNKASTSYVQRRLKIGYNRAASLIERMEEEGIISGPNHAGKREILIKEGA